MHSSRRTPHPHARLTGRTIDAGRLAKILDSLDLYIEEKLTQIRQPAGAPAEDEALPTHLQDPAVPAADLDPTAAQPGRN